MFEANKDSYLKIDTNANYANMRNQSVVIPEIGITYYLSDIIITPFAELEATPYTFTPKLGLSICTFLDFGLGYGFKLKEKETLSQ